MRVWPKSPSRACSSRCETLDMDMDMDMDIYPSGWLRKKGAVAGLADKKKEKCFTRPNSH